MEEQEIEREKREDEYHVLDLLKLYDLCYSIQLLSLNHFVCVCLSIYSLKIKIIISGHYLFGLVKICIYIYIFRLLLILLLLL